MSYFAPTKDMMFLLEAIMERNGIHNIPSLQEFSPDLVATILEEAGKFASGVLAPLNQSGDEQGCRWQVGEVKTPDGWCDAYKMFCESGWMGVALPEAYGGQALPRYIATPINEMWQAANLSFALFYPLNQGGGEIIHQAGTELQRLRYMEPLTSGRWTLAMSLTEPDSGSDLGDIKTSAVPLENGQYAIKGQKIFITYGDHDMAENIVHLVLAKTPGAPAGSRGISLFLVPKFRVNSDGSIGSQNDVRCLSIEHKTGLHGSPTCSMSYGDEGGCVGELVGEENRGLALMFILMNEARLSTGLQGVSIGEAGYQRALGYALDRYQGRNPQTREKAKIVEHADVKRMLLSIRSQVMALRSIAYLIATQIDVAEALPPGKQKSDLECRVALLTPVFKAFSTEAGNLMAGSVIQVFGGMGYVEETGVAQLMRDVRITTIYEGTTGIQANDLVFRKVAADGGEALNTLLEEIAADIAFVEGLSEIGGLVTELCDAISAVSTAAESIVNSTNTDAETLRAGAVPFLLGLGVLCCSWQLCNMAVSARKKAIEGDDIEYHNNIVHLASFYLAHFTPQVKAHLAAFHNGGSGVTNYQFPV